MVSANTRIAILPTSFWLCRQKWTGSINSVALKYNYLISTDILCYLITLHGDKKRNTKLLSMHIVKNVNVLAIANFVLL